MICQYCNEEIMDKAVYCTKCGKKIEALSFADNMQQERNVCMQCGATLTAIMKFCTKCGTKVETETVVESAVEQLHQQEQMIKGEFDNAEKDKEMEALSVGVMAEAESEDPEGELEEETSHKELIVEGVSEESLVESQVLDKMQELERECWVCGLLLASDKKICPSCGNPMQKEVESQVEKVMPKAFSEGNDTDNHISKCTGCGKELIDGSKFCNECGKAVAEIDTKQKKSKRLLIIGMVVACVLIVGLTTMGVVLLNGKKHTINVEDYMVVTFDGYNGYGNANVEFDEEAFAFEVLKYSKIRGVNTKELRTSGNVDAHIAYEQFAVEQEAAGQQKQNAWDTYETDMKAANFEYEVDKITKLKNGDVITISYQFDSEIYEKYGIELVAKPKTYSAEDLAELKEYDALKDYTVIFSGISPYATAEVQVENNRFDEYISYKLDKEYALEKGEIVTLTLYVQEEELARNMGYYVAETSKEYVCDNVSAYVMRLDDISTDLMESMHKQSLDELTTYIALDWIDPSTFQKQKMIGNYLLTAKNNQDVLEGYIAGFNHLFFVYKVNVKTDKDKFSFYYYVCFSDIMMLADGTYSMDMTIYTPPEGYGTFTEGDLIYSGYRKLETFKSKCIDVVLGKYNCETNIEE